MRLVFESPMLKAALTAALAIGMGVLSGSLVTEITTPNGLAWSKFYTTFSFYGLLIFTLLQALFTKLQYEHDREVSKFSDREYCISYMRSKCLPELAAKAQERIRNGGSGEFSAAMKEVEKVLK